MTMPTIKLPEEAEHGEMVRKIDSMIRELSHAPAMTPSSRALGLRPSILMGNHQELAHVMATRTLLNLQKRMIALAVAATKSAPYELYAHTRGLQREYGLDAGQIVELVATIAHVTSINVFEKAIAAFNDNVPMRAQDPSTPVLIEVRQRLGSVPRYFLYMANDPKYAKIVLDREVATVHEGEVSRLNKELVAYATSVVNDGKLSMPYRAEMLRGLGMTNEQLFEATTVISIFAKNSSFSTALQLEPTPA
jgi:alkylhydroperoxidase/carboxymuconolactone decarboxylase family protein YurZ